MTSSVCPIVGIGASAGGLEALKTLFERLPSDSDAAFVVISHLDPAHDSFSAEILARSTSMPVVQVKKGMEVEPNHVYVIPPNTYLTVNGCSLELNEPVLVHGRRMPIDAFLWSLAEQHKECGVAVILSGTGSDGTLGVRAVKGNGGLAVAQSPATARYDGMPRSAIATELVDVVCPVEEMAEHISKYLRHPYIVRIATKETSDAAEKDQDNAPLRAILALLHTQTRHDFRAYKEATVRRRIARRMGLHHVGTMAEYLAFLRTQKDEPVKLFKDLLIGVTTFFRDAGAFEVLAEEVIAPLVKRKRSGEGIRLWVPGCSSGEEAYSLGMLLLERLDATNKDCPVQIFASDVDESALAVGRAGIYPENIAAQVSPARLKRFFSAEGSHYRVQKALRNMVTFARHDLLSDPPFSNLDLISCRNLLIYLGKDVQVKMFDLLHFALRENGHLFLGYSETAPETGELFKPLVQRWRIYQRCAVTAAQGVDLPGGSPDADVVTQQLASGPPHSDHLRLHEITRRVLLQEYAPAAVLVNSNNQVLHFSGRTTRYLQQPSGTPTQDVRNLIRPELRAALRHVLSAAVDSSRRTTASDATMLLDGSQVRVRLTCKPLTDPHLSERIVLVTFEDRSEPELPPHIRKTNTSGSEAAMIQQLEDELNSTREELQSHVEEQESANEELQAANEEVMSVNEELQSTNEELETSKEELQSMNEELTTVNAQLQEKLDELAQSNNDLSNLLSSTDIATLFLDAELKIGRFTPKTKQLLNLISTDVGRPLTDIRQKFADGDLLADSRQVLDRLMPIEREVTTDNGDFYLRRILPYRTGDNRIAGVVITFIDYTARKQAELQAQRLASVVRDSNDAIIVQGLEGDILAWNQGAEQMYGWNEDEALAMPVRRLVPAAEQAANQDLVQRLVAGERVQSFETQRLTKGGRLLDVWLTATPLTDARGEVTAIAATERDITARKRAETALRTSEANFRAVIESAPDAMLISNATDDIKIVNSQAERLFGYSREALLAMPIAKLMPERLRGDYLTNLKIFYSNPMTGVSDWDEDLFALNKDGREIPVEVGISPIATEEGTLVVVSLRDISARKQAEVAIRSAKAAAESASAAKSRFLATASHDLRQPLQSLNLLNAALRKIITDPKAQKMLTMQDESLSGMGRLLNSLLDISQLESGSIHPASKDTALWPIFERLQAEFEAEAAAKGLQLQVDSTDAVVNTDPTLLAQLLQNLLANAVRYTPEGSVRLSCKRGGDERLRITVEDTGIGIPAAELTRIFEEFHQVNRNPQQRDGGLGLGLSIVQRIANLLETSIDVQSRLGRGSTFSLTVPAGDAQAIEPIAPAAQALQAACSSGRILLIDDDADVLDAAQILLSLEDDLDISTCASPPAAYALLEEFTPDLIITDYNLNHEDTGIDVVRAARKRAGWSIPTIVVSGDTALSLSEFGIEDARLMSKPIKSEDLILMIHKLLRVTTRSPETGSAAN